jgi:hypothetical protein
MEPADRLFPLGIEEKTALALREGVIGIYLGGFCRVQRGVQAKAGWGF